MGTLEQPTAKIKFDGTPKSWPMFKEAMLKLAICMVDRTSVSEIEYHHHRPPLLQCQVRCIHCPARVPHIPPLSAHTHTAHAHTRTHTHRFAGKGQEHAVAREI